MTPLRPALLAIALAPWAAPPTVVLAQAKKVELPRGQVVEVEERLGGRRVAQPRVVQGQVFRVEVLEAQALNLELVNQYAQLYLPFLQAEYHRLRRSCDPTPDQRKLIARAGDLVLDSVARQTALRTSRPVQWTVAGRAPSSDPVKTIAEGLAEAAKTHLRPEQWACFAAEIEARSQERKEATIDQIVVELDNDLFLSAGQRDRIRAVLTSRWDDAWVASIDQADSPARYFPTVTEPIAPILSDAQYSAMVFRANSRIGFVRRLALVFDPMPVNNLLEDEDLAEAQRVRLNALGAKEAAAPGAGPKVGGGRP